VLRPSRYLLSVHKLSGPRLNGHRLNGHRLSGHKLNGPRLNVRGLPLVAAHLQCGGGKVLNDGVYFSQWLSALAA